MGGVDVADVMLHTYSDERRSVKYWKKVTFHIMPKMVVNSYLLNTENDRKNWIKGKNMSSSPQSTQPAKGYGIIKLPGVLLQSCQVCTYAWKKSRSHHICANCEKGVHPSVCLIINAR